MRRHWFPKGYADRVARLRVPAGFLLAVAFFWLSAPGARSLAAGLLISALGLALRAWAAGHLAKNESLATSGPYSYIRNPLYAGTMLVIAGLVIAARSPWLGLACALTYLLVYFPVIELEEQHLRDLFRDYGDYASRVPLLIPRGRRIAATQHFRVELYMRNEEYRALGGFLLAMTYLVVRVLKG